MMDIENRDKIKLKIRVIWPDEELNMLKVRKIVLQLRISFVELQKLYVSNQINIP